MPLELESAPLMRGRAAIETISARGSLYASLARTETEVREFQRLRYQVFAEELGASVQTVEPGVEADRFDPYCDHLLVRDSASGAVVAGTRILNETQAERAGGFYSASEFELDPILNAPGHTVEIGRTCVHKNYRRGVTISVLWAGFARAIDLHYFSRIIGCASIPMHEGSAGAWAAYAYLKCAHIAPPELRVKPKRAVPPCEAAAQAPLIPSLLKAYIRLGGKIGGEPYWDTAFNTADLLILVQPKTLRERYARRYLAKQK